jgi:hypothetical protein
MVPPEAMIQEHKAESGYVPGPSDITPELVPLDGSHRHSPEHVTVPVVFGNNGGAGVVGAGVVVMPGGAGVVVVRWMKHTEAVKPSRTSLSSVWKITLMCPSAVYLAVRVSGPKSAMRPSAFDP